MNSLKDMFPGKFKTYKEWGFQPKIEIFNNQELFVTYLSSNQVFSSRTHVQTLFVLE